MKVEIAKSELKGKINAPSSKSYAQRLVVLSAFLGNQTTLENIELSNDVKASFNFVKGLGAECCFKDNSVKINSITTIPKQIKFDLLDCGFTLRTAIAVCYLLGINAEIICSESLSSRPITPLINALNGTKDIQKTDYGYRVNGKCNKISILDASESSQYVSAIMIGLAVLGGGEFEVINAVSKDYINITQNCLEKFGYNCSQKGKKYIIEKNNKPFNQVIKCEGDWTNSAVMLALGILGEVSVKGLNLSSEQGDKRIVEILKNIGLIITSNGDEIISKRGEIHSGSYAIDENIDLALIISALLSLANEKSEIKGINRLKIKESNRADGIIEIIHKFGGNAQIASDSIIINNCVKNGATVDGNNDHRIVMTATLYGLVFGDTVITGAECIEKSYPRFFDDVRLLGGKIDVKD